MWIPLDYLAIGASLVYSVSLFITLDFHSWTGPMLVIYLKANIKILQMQSGLHEFALHCDSLHVFRRSSISKSRITSLSH